MANSIANLSYNLLGYFPAPSIYGFAVYISGHKDSGWGMGALMYTSVFMFIFILLAVLKDKNVDYSSIFSGKKSVVINESSLDNDKTNEDDTPNERPSLTEKKSSNLPTINLGIGIAETYGHNELLEMLSANPAQSNADSEEGKNHPLVDHKELN